MGSSATLVEPNGESPTEVSDAEGAVRCLKTSPDNLFVILSLSFFKMCSLSPTSNVKIHSFNTNIYDRNMKGKDINFFAGYYLFV